MSYYDSQEWSLDFASFEDLAVSSNSSSVDPFPPDATDHDILLEQLLKESFVDNDPSSLSSFWDPAYAFSALPLDNIGHEASSSYTTSVATEPASASALESAGSIGTELIPQYVDWLGAGDRTWTEEAELPPPSCSSHQFSFTDSSDLDLGSQLSTIQSRPPTPSEAGLLCARSPSPFVRSLSPSPSPSPSPSSSSFSSTKASDATKVDSKYDAEQDDLSEDDSDQEYRPVKVRKTAKGRKTTAYRKRGLSYSHDSGAADEFEASSSVRGQKRKRADASSLRPPNSPKRARQRRRNIQVRLSGESARPIPLPEGRFQCPVLACSRCMSHEPAMKRHINSHLGKGLKCPVCENIYSRIDAVKRHLSDIPECREEANRNGLVPIPVEH